MLFDTIASTANKIKFRFLKSVHMRQNCSGCQNTTTSRVYERLLVAGQRATCREYERRKDDNRECGS